MICGRLLSFADMWCLVKFRWNIGLVVSDCSQGFGGYDCCGMRCAVLLYVSGSVG